MTTAIKQWCNKDKHVLYQSLPISVFVEYAHLAGVANGEDILSIQDYILGSQSILELGFGYGRVLNKILSSGYTGHFDAIEYENK